MDWGGGVHSGLWRWTKQSRDRIDLPSVSSLSCLALRSREMRRLLLKLDFYRVAMTHWVCFFLKKTANVLALRLNVVYSRSTLLIIVANYRPVSMTLVLFKASGFFSSWTVYRV